MQKEVEIYIRNIGKQKHLIVGKVLIIVLHCLILWGFYTTYYYKHQSTIIQILRSIQIPLWILLEICYIRVIVSDPGRVKQKTVPLIISQISPLYQKVCKKCNTWKPPRAHHCSRCNQCIFKLDHHCEWINNCIGALNQKYFVLFVMYMSLFLLINFFLHLIGIGDYCLNLKRRNFWSSIMTITYTKCQIFTVLIIIVFFFIFLCSVLYDQWIAIYDNQTIVESHQGKYGHQQSFINNIKQVFGNEKWYFWLIPTKPQLRLNYAELVYSENMINEGDQFLEDIIYDSSNPQSIHFQEFMIENYYKKKL